MDQHVPVNHIVQARHGSRWSCRTVKSRTERYKVLGPVARRLIKEGKRGPLLSQAVGSWRDGR